jgi:hypothetical protein
MNWINIPWYELKYQLNYNTNEIKSLNYNRSWISKVLKLHKWKLYLRVCLSIEWIYKNYDFHQLVMLIKEWTYTKDWLEICHNDWNSLNNHPDNLRFDTKESNMKDRYIHWFKSNFQLSHPKPHLWKFWIFNKNSKKINQYTLDWIFVKTFDSITEAAYSIWRAVTNISSVCNWKRKKTWWYIWKYL